MILGIVCFQTWFLGKLIFLSFKWDKNQLYWVSIYLFIISYEGHRCIIENERHSNPKLIRCFDNLKHEAKSCYNDILMHNYMIWLVYALIVDEINYIDDEIITLIDECIELYWLISWWWYEHCLMRCMWWCW